MRPDPACVSRGPPTRRAQGRPWQAAARALAPIALATLAATAVALAPAAASGGAVSASGGADAAARARGEQVYARCAGCHAIGANRTGPQHCGLFGRRAGTAPGFTGYTPAMKAQGAQGLVWTAQTLDAFLADPMAKVPGTAMGYAGVKDPRERADLIAWLAQAARPGAGGCTMAP